MPRSKRRSVADMGHDDDDRHCSKRSRNTSRVVCLGFVVGEVVVGQTTVTDCLSHDMAFLSGLEPEKTVTKNVALSAMGSVRRFSKTEDTSSSFSQKRCIAWFREYTSPDDPDILGPEGMEKFCEDIGVEPENVVMLVLAWKMNARQMGFFTQQEWLRGLMDLQCDSIGKVQNKLDYLRMLLNDQVTFKSIYRYAYDFARDKDQRSMDIETAQAMLQLLLGKHWALFGHFSNFLENSKYKVINKDQWCNILEFSRTIVSDLSNYDVDGAWPVMLDEFVEWLKASKELHRS